MQSEWYFKHVLIDKVKRTAHPLTKLVHRRAKVARVIQLFFQPAVVEFVGVSSEFFHEEVFAFTTRATAKSPPFSRPAGLLQIQLHRTTCRISSQYESL